MGYKILLFHMRSHEVGTTAKHPETINDDAKDSSKR